MNEKTMTQDKLINGRHTKRWRSGYEERFGPRTGELIRDYLKEYGGAGYPYEAWNYYREKLREAMPEKCDGKAESEYHIGTYQSFYRYFYILENLGVIKKHGTPQYGKAKIPRQYYTITSPQFYNPEYDQLWEHVQILLYPITRLGKRRYKKLKEEVDEYNMILKETFKVDVRLTPIQFIMGEEAVPPEIIRLFEEIDMGEQILSSLTNWMNIAGYPQILQYMGSIGYNIEDVSRTLLKMHRTLDYVRTPKLPPDIKVLQDELRDREETLKECMKVVEEFEEEIKKLKEEIIEAEKVPITRFTPMINDVLGAISMVKETRTALPLEEQSYNIYILVESWEELQDEERKKLCEAVLTMPDYLIDEVMEVEQFKQLFEKCIKR
jgi:hypothetical protein